MATDATGTPSTNFDFPKYNVDVDAPSGLGLNAIVDDIDSKLFTKFVHNEAAGLAADEVPVWDGSAWVYQKITQANMAAGNKTTRRDIDDGPPGSPTDGDIWIAEDVGGENSGVAWMFVYNADSSSTYKWEFIGGAPATAAVSAAQAPTGAIDTWANLATDGPAITLAREGDYEARASVRISSTAGGVRSSMFGLAIGNTSPTNPIPRGTLHENGYELSLAIASARINGIAAGGVLKHRYQTNSNSMTFSNRQLAVVPVRVI